MNTSKLSVEFLRLIASASSWVLPSVAIRNLPIFAAALVILCSCKPAARNAVSPAPPPIKVATQYSPGIFWLAIAGEKGWFKEAGLNVQLVDTNTDYLASVKDFTEGQFDVNALVLFDLLDSVVRGANLVGIIAVDYSAAADKLIARPGIEHLADLKGKKIAVPQKSYFGYVLETAIRREGLKLKDVQVVDVPPEKAPEALIHGEADAMLTFEPYATQGLVAVKGHNLFDASQVPGLSPTLIVFHRNFIEQRPSEVAAFVKVWERATTFIKEYPDEAFAIVASGNRKTPEEVRQFAQTDNILDLQDNELSFSFAAGLDSLYGAVRQMNDFMIAKGLTDKRLDSSQFLDSAFIRALKEERRTKE
jgi:NitT/TauT family transport system substrate-binding protein